MDGREHCMDTIFIERLWHSLKYEAIYMHELAICTELEDGSTTRRVIGDWIRFYDTHRPHSALDDKTPNEAYWNRDLSCWACPTHTITNGSSMIKPDTP